MIFWTNLIVDSRPCGSHWPVFVQRELFESAPGVAFLLSQPVGRIGAMGKNS